MVVPPAQLSCEQCQHRKTKCSKTVPCSACVKAGISCTAVQRHRLPRGRSRVQKRDDANVQALMDRVGRLETIISQFQSLDSFKEPLSNSGSREPNDRSGTAATPVESYVAPDFWLQLSDAVAGLKDVLEQDDTPETVIDEQGTTSTGLTNSVDSHSILFGSSSSQTDLHTTITSETREWLLTIYKERVDAMFKPLHWPSALSTIRSQHRRPSLTAQTLECAVYFTAACSLLSFERDQRGISVDELRKATETAFIQAGLLTTTSLVVLQAFVIYLAGLRTVQATAQQWTLIATAIRIANAQGIPTRFQTTCFGEIQRRVWYCIGVLDLQSAFDRGSQPLIKSDDFGTLPLDIDDIEIASLDLPPPARTQARRYTEMSLSLMIFQAGVCQRRITEIGMSVSMQNGPVDPTAAVHEQIAVLEEFEGHVERLTELCNESPSPLKRFTMAVAHESAVAMRLQLHRPLYRRPAGHTLVDASPLTNLDVLTTATEVLERSQMKRTQLEFAPWAWFSWVKWYALAVVLAELCTAQGSQADRAWIVAQQSFDGYAKAVADEQYGLLWKPIVNLMRKAKAVQKRRLLTSPAIFNTANHPSRDEAMNLETTPSSIPSDPTLPRWDDRWANNFNFMDSNGLGSNGDEFGLHWNLLIDDLNDFDSINT